MKSLFLSAAAAIAAVAIAPALAQTAAPAPGAQGQKVTTRADMVQKVQQHFAKIDADGDGVVTQAEAQAARSTLRQHAGGRMEHDPAAMFDHMDANKDGAISRAEFVSVHEKKSALRRKGDGGGHGGHSAMGGRIFAMADSNNDGRVTLQEATAAAAVHFDRADANRDGTLTRDERRSAHRTHSSTSR